VHLVEGGNEEEEGAIESSNVRGTVTISEKERLHQNESYTGRKGPMASITEFQR